EQLRVQLASPETRIRLAGGLIKTEGLALEAISETGRSGIVDAEVTIDQKNQIDATFNLRPTSLAVLAAASPAISRADGDLSARFSLKGPLASPTMSGFIEIAEGRVLLNGFSSPVSDLFVTVA